MRRTIYGYLALVYFAAAGCNADEKENKSTSVDDGVAALQEYVVVNRQFQDASNGTDDAVVSAESLVSSGKKSATDGPEITVEPLGDTWPKTITVDFGDGITGQDGIVRSGILHIVSTGWYRTVGSVHTTTFEDYYQNGYLIEGTHVATNLGNNQEGYLQYNVIVTNGKVTYQGNSITFNQNTTRTWVVGSETPLNIWDDEYTLDGNQSGVSSDEVAYSISISEALYFKLLTHEVTSGIMDVTIEGLPAIELNYTNSTITIGLLTFPLDEE